MSMSHIIIAISMPNTVVTRLAYAYEQMNIGKLCIWHSTEGQRRAVGRAHGQFGWLTGSRRTYFSIITEKSKLLHSDGIDVGSIGARRQLYASHCQPLADTIKIDRLRFSDNVVHQKSSSIQCGRCDIHRLDFVLRDQIQIKNIRLLSQSDNRSPNAFIFIRTNVFTQNHSTHSSSLLACDRPTDDTNRMKEVKSHSFESIK